MIDNASRSATRVALSIVGIDRTDNGYFRAKVAQEKLMRPARLYWMHHRA
jgi:hypothetical protein